MHRIVRAALAAALVWAGQAGAATMYVATPLTTDTQFAASAINAAGLVVGSVGIGDGMTAYSVIPGANPVAVSDVFGGSDARAVSDAGHITGYFENSAFLNLGPTTTILPALPGGGAVVGNAVNSSGHVVGQSGGRGFLYRDGQTQALAVPDGASVYAADINDAGLIVGTWALAGAVGRAAVYQDGGMLDLGVGALRAVNQGGTAVGIANGAMFTWASGVTSNLGQFDGPSTLPIDISDSGRIVGIAGSRTFVWDGGVFHDLAAVTDFSAVPSEWFLSSFSPTSINGTNYIVATMLLSDTSTSTVSVLLSPVPEPHAGLLAVIALLVIHAHFRRRSAAARA